MNKTSAIVRLIIWSVVLVVLIGLFAVSFTGVSGIHFIKGGIAWSDLFYNDADYNVGHYAEYSENVENITIEWIDDSIKVQLYDGDKVIVEDTYNGDNKFYLMRSKVENGNLTIKYCAPGINFMRISGNKDLTVKIPKSIVGLDDINIDAVSSNISIKDVVFDRYKINCVSSDVDVDIPKPADGQGYSSSEINCENVSGRINIKGSFKNVDISSVSGKIELYGAYNSVAVESVSGELFLTAEDTFPSDIDVSTVSGDVVVETLEGVDLSEGFEVDMDSVSGKVYTVTGDGTNKHGSGFTYGAGKSRINIETVSGDFKIKY